MKKISSIIFFSQKFGNLEAFSQNRGISNLVVIICVTLACIGMVTSYILASRLNTTIEKVRYLEKERELIDEEYKEIQGILLDISPMVMDVTETKPIVEVKEIQQYLGEKIKQYGLVSKIDREAEIGGEDVTLEVIVRKAAENLAHSEIYLSQTQFGKVASEERLKKFKDILRTVEDIRESEKRELRAKIEALSQLEIKEKGDYERRIEEVKKEIERLDNEKPIIEKKHRDEKTNLRNQINLIIQKLEQLAIMEMITRDVTVAHGAIFNVDVSNSCAFINLGKEHGIKRGLKFRVFRKGKGGVKHWKGQVEVKQVFDTFSQVSITHVENPSDPIVEGNLIANVFYDKKKPPRVVLIGMFERPDFNYGLSEIKRRLLDLGVTVEETISLYTDFVIIGKNPEERTIDRENYYWAKKLGLPRFEGQEARDCIKYYLGD